MISKPASNDSLYSDYYYDNLYELTNPSEPSRHGDYYIPCDYCGEPAQLVDSAIVYGRSYGMIYYCPHCSAWVGVHQGTNRPLGRLANAELRDWKKKAHAAFDPLWQGGRLRRNSAYAWLAEKMGKPVHLTHIGMFDVPDCKQVVQICAKEITHGSQQEPRKGPRPHSSAATGRCGGHPD